MEEKFISGYCRAIDAARTVTAEKEDGIWTCSCAFGGCCHEGSCQIAMALAALQEDE